MVRIDPDDPLGHKAIVEAESVRIVRRRGDLIISETRHGFVCANAGVDLSNVDDGLGRAAARRQRPLGPPHPRRPPGGAGVEVAVIVSDTFGRPWRRGLTDVAIGCAGIRAVVDLRGTEDSRGRELQVTEVCVVDELAGAAELVMGKATGVAAAIVRGVDPAWLGRARCAARWCGPRRRTCSADARPALISRGTRRARRPRRSAGRSTAPTRGASRPGPGRARCGPARRCGPGRGWPAA